MSQEFCASSQWNHHRISTNEWLVSYNGGEYNPGDVSDAEEMDLPLVTGLTSDKWGPIPRF